MTSHINYMHMLSLIYKSLQGFCIPSAYINRDKEEQSLLIKFNCREHKWATAKYGSYHILQIIKLNRTAEQMIYFL